MIEPYVLQKNLENWKRRCTHPFMFKVHSLKICYTCIKVWICIIKACYILDSGLNESHIQILRSLFRQSVTRIMVYYRLSLGFLKVINKIKFPIQFMVYISERILCRKLQIHFELMDVWVSFSIKLIMLINTEKQ